MHTIGTHTKYRINPTRFRWPAAAAGLPAGLGAHAPARTDLAAALAINLMPFNIFFSSFKMKISVLMCAISRPQWYGVVGGARPHIRIEYQHTTNCN